MLVLVVCLPVRQFVTNFVTFFSAMIDDTILKLDIFEVRFQGALAHSNTCYNSTRMEPYIIGKFNNCFCVLMLTKCY